MKKFLLSIVLATFVAGNAIAQPISAERLRWDGVYNNRFWSNWEIGIGGGVNYTAWDGLFKDQPTGDVGWQAEISATKWFNPIIGARVQMAVGQLNASDNDGLKNTWMLPHANTVVNLSNWIGGYRDDRVYYAKLFAGAGVSFVNVGDDYGAGLAAVGGMINTFRVGRALDINLELKAVVTAGRDMPRGIASLADHIGQIYSATVGITYRFNNRGWERAYSQTDVDAYIASMALLEAEVESVQRNEVILAERLAAERATAEQMQQENATIKAQMSKLEDEEFHAISTAIFFNLNSAELSDRAKASLMMLSESIKAAPEDQIFSIVGHADDQTGTPNYNLALSEQRAKAVYDYLIELGIDKSRLVWKGVGSTENVFPINSTNRVVIIK